MNYIFVKFKSKIYQQVIGIPMGCDCAPKIADLFLHWYEHNYISEAVDNPNLTFPNLRSNIPKSQAYGSFTGKLYRLCKSSTCFADFKDEIRMLMKKRKNQNFDVNELKKRICNVKPLHP